MRKTLLLLLALALCSCAHRVAPVHYTAPSAAKVRATVQTARRAVSAVQVSVTGARASLTAAQGEAKTLAAAAPAELQATAAQLQSQLGTAAGQLDEATQHAAEADRALALSEQHAGDLQQQIDAQTDNLNREATEKNQALADLSRAEASARKQTGLAWKWRVIALFEVAAVLGFFALRQYFPFLKLL